MQKHIDDTMADSQKRLEDDVIAKAAAELAELAYQAALTALNGIQEGRITVRELQKVIDAQLRASLNPDQLASGAAGCR